MPRAAAICCALFFAWTTTAGFKPILRCFERVRVTRFRYRFYEDPKSLTSSQNGSFPPAVQRGPFSFLSGRPLLDVGRGVLDKGNFSPTLSHGGLLCWGYSRDWALRSGLFDRCFTISAQAFQPELRALFV